MPREGEHRHGPRGGDARLAMHLLGRLPADQRHEVEESLFLTADEGVLDELQAAGDDLIQAYLAGALSPEDRAAFEAHFLAAPRHRERLEFMRDLLSAVDEVSAEDAPARARTSSGQRPWAFAAAAAVAAAGTLVVLTMRRGDPEPPRPSQPPATAVAQRPVAATPSPEVRPRWSAPTAAEVRVLRLPRLAAGPVPVALTSRTRSVQVEVAVDEDKESPSFDAVVRTRGGTEVWRARRLAAPADGRTLVVSLPARVLASQDYVLMVQGESLREGETFVREYVLRVNRADANASRR